MSDIKEYVVGFMFLRRVEDYHDAKKGDIEYVYLIRKSRPDWQKGLYNGIGGHIENDETPEYTIVREFKEETGFETIQNDWSKCAVISGDTFIVHFFYAFADLTVENFLHRIRTKTDEIVTPIPAFDFYRYPVIYNLKWLIPLCLDCDIKKPVIFKDTNVVGSGMSSLIPDMYCNKDI